MIIIYNSLIIKYVIGVFLSMVIPKNFSISDQSYCSLAPQL